MSWRDQLKPASFRGVPFFVDSSSYQGGRRVQLHEYPLRDLPFAEDLGRKARTYQLEAYVLEPRPWEKTTDTYMTRRDALITALETAGPGALVHPFLGTKQVVMGPYSVSENFKEGGKAVFSVPFIEAGQLLEPDALTDTQSAVGAAGIAAAAALSSDFAAKFSILDKAKWLSDAAVKKLGQISNEMQDLSQLIAVPSAVTAVVSAAQGFSSSLTGLISAPSDLAAQIVGIIALIPTMAEQPLDALDLYKNGLFSFGATDLPVQGSAASQLQQLANRDAVNTLVKGLAITGFAGSSAAVPSRSSISFPSASSSLATTGQKGYDTSDAATAVLQDFLDAVDDLLPDLGDAGYAAMLDLRAAVMADLQSRAAALPELIQWIPSATMPALLAAQIRYGDATRADEIVARNDIPDPGFVQGGRTLEVLSV